MLISVIIPTKNRLDFLKRAIKSVWDQTYKNFQIIVINDGSTDDTEEWLYNNTNNGLKYHSFKHSVGGGQARNKGLEIADGKYIAFLDDDDQWLPSKLSEQVKLLDKSSFVGTKLNIITRKKDRILGLLRLVSDRLTFLGGRRASFREVYFHNTGISPSSVVMDRSKLLKIGGFDVNLKANQGRDLFIRYSLQYECPYIVNMRLVNQYQDHEDRISSNFDRRLEAQEILHERYVGVLSASDKCLSEANMLLLELKREKDPSERKRIERSIWTKMRRGNISDFLKLMLIYRITK